MIPLIRAAGRAGHDVVVSTGPDLSPFLKRLGVASAPAGPTAADSYADLPNNVWISRLPPEEQSAFAAKYLFGAAAKKRAGDLTVLVSDWRPEPVIHDPLELGAAAVAMQTGTAQVTHGYGPMLAENDDLIASIGSELGRTFGADPTVLVDESPYLDICPSSLQTRKQMPWLDVRPLQPSAGEPADGSVAALIADLPYRDSVYLTLGTVMNQSAGVFRAAIEASMEVGVNIVATTGPNLDPPELGPLPPSALVSTFLPQADVLPYCSAVVSHAGAGTMLGALCHGLPQLCLPQSTDQPFNAAVVVAAGAALALQPNEITTPAVAEVLDRVLHEPPLREAAERLRTEIDAMPLADQVLTDLVAWAHR